MIKDASSSSSSSSLFQISAKTLERAFAQTSYLSYETVKQSTQRASVFAREKALREREKRKEASERAKKDLREEHARIEREIERRLERKEEEEKEEKKEEGADGNRRHREKERDETKQKECEERSEHEKKDIVRLESEAARLKQKQMLLEVEFEIETKREAERVEREARRKEKEGSRKLEKLRKEVEVTKETLENEKLSHERFVQSMLGDATFWTSEVERRNEKREEDAESERKALLETLERTDAKATRLEEAKDALRNVMERRVARMNMIASIIKGVSADIVIA